MHGAKHTRFDIVVCT